MELSPHFIVKRVKGENMNQTSNPFQSVVTLGKLHEIHPYDSGRRRNRFVLSWGVLSAMLCCLSLTAYAFIDDAAHFSAASSDVSPAFVIGAFAFMMLLGGVIIFQSLRQWWKVRKVAVGVFEQSLAYCDAEGALQLIPWTSIRRVDERWVRSGRIRFVEYYVSTSDGKLYLLHHSLRDVHKLTGFVKQTAGL